ncbi:hypothetical protein BH18ACT6_BH18ACT6_26040 [soil metagenome]
MATNDRQRVGTNPTKGRIEGLAVGCDGTGNLRGLDTGPNDESPRVHCIQIDDLADRHQAEISSVLFEVFSGERLGSIHVSPLWDA